MRGRQRGWAVRHPTTAASGPVTTHRPLPCRRRPHSKPTIPQARHPGAGHGGARSRAPSKLHARLGSAGVRVCVGGGWGALGSPPDTCCPCWAVTACEGWLPESVPGGGTPKALSGRCGGLVQCLRGRGAGVCSCCNGHPRVAGFCASGRAPRCAQPMGWFSRSQAVRSCKCPENLSQQQHTGPRAGEPDQITALTL